MFVRTRSLSNGVTFISRPNIPRLRLTLHLLHQSYVTIWYPCAISYRCSIVTESVSPAVFEIMDPKYFRVTTLTFQFSRVVIDHVTNRFPIGHFLLVVHWYQVSISKWAITSKIKHAIKHTTNPAKLAQLLQPSLAFCFNLQPMTAYRRKLDCTQNRGSTDRPTVISLTSV